MARAPHLAAVEIDPRRVVLQLTSNKADITTDCVRILKQPEGYRFRSYGEGDVLDHVRANQPAYLGAVFAIAKVWHAAGRPRTNATGHDFRPWDRKEYLPCRAPADRPSRNAGPHGHAGA